MRTFAAHGKRNRFEDTRWSLVCAVQADGGAEPARREAALEEFCGLYWYPLYAFARRSGRSAADAEDLIQGLFAKLLAGDGLEGLSPERGRVRSFLLQSLRNLMVGEWQKGQRQRRGGGAVHVSMNVVEGEERFLAEPSTGLTPEREYERQWAATVLRQAAEQLEAEFVKSDRQGIFTALSDCLGGECEKTYHELGAELGMTVGAIKVTVHRMRGRFRALVLGEIGETVGSEAELMDEVAHLYRVFE